VTGARLRLGFALGAVVAGTLVAALRIAGVSDRSTAVADEASAPARAQAAAGAVSAPPPASSPPSAVTPQAAARWRKPSPPAAVTARVVSRAARAPASARPAQEACTPRPAEPGAAPGGTGAGPRADAACGARTESVEIDWHAPTATP
jgi:hypothetical protein